MNPELPFCPRYPSGRYWLFKRTAACTGCRSRCAEGRWHARVSQACCSGKSWLSQKSLSWWWGQLWTAPCLAGRDYAQGLRLLAQTPCPRLPSAVQGGGLAQSSQTPEASHLRPGRPSFCVSLPSLQGLQVSLVSEFTEPDLRCCQAGALQGCCQPQGLPLPTSHAGAARLSGRSGRSRLTGSLLRLRFKCQQENASPTPPSEGPSRGVFPPVTVAGC